MKSIPMDNAVGPQKPGKPLQRLQLYKEPAECNRIHCKGSHFTKEFQILVTETSCKLCYFTLNLIQSIHYHSCSIDKYRNVEGLKCHNFGRLGISYFEKEGFCKNHPKSRESFLHIPSPNTADLRFPYARDLRYHLPFRGPIRLTNNFYTHVQDCITIVQ